MKSDPISIITDSTCDIPHNLVEQYGIQIVSHLVIWGTDQYLDRVDLQPEEFYRRLQTDPFRPTTSQAGVPDFVRAFQCAVEKGAKQILAVIVSSKMSGAYQMACQAAEMVNIPVRVMDGRGPTMSIGWQVLAAARARDAGLDFPAIIEEVEAVRKKLVLYVGMDTMEYFQRGGRMGSAIRWMGMALDIKPLVRINHESGLVEPAMIGRTRKSVIETMIRKFFEQVGSVGDLHIAVLHGNAPEDAASLAERIRQEYSPAELLINITGPVLGINTGPRALALSGYRE